MDRLALLVAAETAGVESGAPRTCCLALAVGAAATLVGDFEVTRFEGAGDLAEAGLEAVAFERSDAGAAAADGDLLIRAAARTGLAGPEDGALIDSCNARKATKFKCDVRRQLVSRIKLMLCSRKAK